MAEVQRETAASLRGIAEGERSVLEGIVAAQVENLEDSGLDARTYSLVKIASLVAVGAPPASYATQIALAAEAGVSAEDVLGVLVAVAPQVGLPRVVAAAPQVMLALGLAQNP